MKKSKEEKKPEKKSGDPYKKKQIISLSALIVGVLTLIAGIIILVISLTRGPEVADGEFLVSVGEWKLDEGEKCEATEEKKDTESEEVKTEEESEPEEKTEESSECKPSVIWKFTEIGKGSLTTNGHINDYDFIWSLEDGKLSIETKWLYDMNNEYEYSLDQSGKVLTLKNDDREFRFVANQ